MTKRILRTVANGRPVLLTMGWNRDAQSHFMTVELASVTGEPIFEEEKPARQETLSYLSALAAGFGIVLPPLMVATLRVDEALDIGRATSYFDDFGNESYA